MLVAAPVDAANRTTTTTRRRATTTTEPTRTTRTTAAEPRSTSTTGTTRRATTTTANASHSTTRRSTAPTRASTTSSTAAKRPTKNYIVVLKKGNRSSVVAEEHRRTRKVKIQKVYGHAIRGYAADIPDDEIDAIKKDKRVDYVARTKPMAKLEQTLPWGVEKVSRKGDDWSSTRPGDGTGTVNMDVYVIDTGIAAQADLVGGTDVNFRGGPDTDCDGHGTHMAGIVGAADNGIGVVGVAPSVRVHGVKVLDCGGKGTDAHAVAGLDWVVQHGARPSVITMSFGGPISAPFDAAVRRAVEAGFAVFAAAGNDHANACNSSPAHMGEMDGVITVGATTDRDRLAPFSNGGPCVDVYAPGVSIPSLTPTGGLALATGTSASAPHAAGVGALAKAANGGLLPAQLEAQIKQHAVRIGGARRSVLRVSSAEF